MRLTDANLEGECCRLPFRFPFDYFSYIYLPNSTYRVIIPNIVSFVNCSNKIVDSMYQHVSCLSGNNSYVYVLNGYSAMNILPSCSFLSMVPLDRDIWDDPISGFNISQLEKGFTITWVATSRNIQYCLRLASKEVSSDDKKKNIFIWFHYPFQVASVVLGCLDSEKQYYLRALYWVVSLGTVAILLAIVIVIRLVLIPLCIYVYLTYEYWIRMVPIDIIERFLRTQQSLTTKRYAYIDIIAMTDNFKEKLGQGGFGSVYKGKLPGGHHLVAVKMLENSKFNGDDFISEVSTIGMIHHLNVVRLVGFCSQRSKCALIYEFMPNGSVDKFIFSSNRSHRRFTMKKLNEIALGVARGIDYLHRGCEMRILHFDIKPHNILLDQNFNPKVSDFGLAKLYPKDYSVVSISAVRGTVGYIAPELVSRSFGVISNKSDVYSFGMLLMEMAGGRKNVDNKAENSSQVYYPSWIYDKLEHTEQPEISNWVKIDEMERKLCKVGLWCIQMRPSDRPSMSRVIEMLEADVDTLEMPPKPFLSSAGHVSTRESCMDLSLTELSIISEDE